jgi:hypothetical protein
MKIKLKKITVRNATKTESLQTTPTNQRRAGKYYKCLF